MYFLCGGVLRGFCDDDGWFKVRCVCLIVSDIYREIHSILGEMNCVCWTLSPRRVAFLDFVASWRLFFVTVLFLFPMFR